jgi:hypothetical protein
MKMLLDSTFWTRQRIVTLVAGVVLCLLMTIGVRLLVELVIALNPVPPDPEPVAVSQGAARNLGVIQSLSMVVTFIAGITMAVLAADVLTPQNRALIEIMATTRWTLARQAVRALLMAVAGTAAVFSGITALLVGYGLVVDGPRSFEVGHEVLLFVGGLLNLVATVWVLAGVALICTLRARSSRVGAAAGVAAVVFITLVTLPPSNSEVQYMWLLDLSGLLNYPAQWVLVRLLYAFVAAAALLFALKRYADPRFLLRTAPSRSGTRLVRSQKRGAVEVSALAARLRPPIRPESALGAALIRFEARTAQYGYLILLELRGARLVVVHVILIVIWLGLATIAITGSPIQTCTFPKCASIQFWQSFGTILGLFYALLVSWVAFDAVEHWRGSGLEHLSLSITSPSGYLRQRALTQISATLVMFVIFVCAHYSVVSLSDFDLDPAYWAMFLQAFVGVTVYGAGVVVLCAVTTSMVGASLVRPSWTLATRLSICLLSAVVFMVSSPLHAWSLWSVRDTIVEWMMGRVGAAIFFPGLERPQPLSSTVMLAAVVLAVAFAGVMIWGGGRLYTRRVRSE